MKAVLGVGVDLTQHVPMVAQAVFSDATDGVSKLDPAVLVRHWPPPIELYRGFCPQPPVCLLPIMHGEPPLVGDAAARHRRAAGLPWPPEAQLPYGGDEEAGIGRIPLLAAWMALVPALGQAESMSRRADPEFGWRPGGRNISVPAGRMIALSLRAFLQDAGVSIKACRVAVVVPDALDEAGQQILLDACSEVGLDSGSFHLLPRPLAAALHWCHSASHLAAVQNAPEDEEGWKTGRLRVLTTAMDFWEAFSLEIRARRQFGRIWLVPVRDRTSLADARPEMNLFGVQLAITLAGQQPSALLADWWLRLFGSPWLDQWLKRNISLRSDEAQSVQAVLGGRLPDSVRRDFRTLTKHHSIWGLLGQAGSGMRPLKEGLWEKQEQLLETVHLPLLETIADGAFSRLLCDEAAGLFAGVDADSRMRVYGDAAVRGAALAAAAIAYGLPCYREKLLPLDLCVRGRDDYGDPVLQWKQLIAATSVEAGGTWRSPEPVAGLKIQEGQDRLVLPLRRSIRGQNSFRRVATELTKPAEHEEAVHVEVEVKPGQGFARVRIESLTPGVFSTRLDWSTMEECEEPKREPLAYIPGVSRIVPDRQMFEQAEPAMRAALHALQINSANAPECLRELIRLLNKWPLAHNVERRRGHAKEKDLLLHYGIIGSDGKLDDLPEPRLAGRLRNLIGERFGELVEAGVPNSLLGKALLRAAGWFYLAMPRQCYSHLRDRIREAERGGTLLSGVELGAIGLAFENVSDLRRFYPLVVEALDRRCASNNWLRALRNICRFRNHALSPEVISDAVLTDLIELVYSRIRDQVDSQNFGRILANCLETLPFLLKRRRYDPSFLAPDEELAVRIIRLLKDLEANHRQQLPTRLQEVPGKTIRFMHKQATASDLEALLSTEEGEDENE